MKLDLSLFNEHFQSPHNSNKFEGYQQFNDDNEDQRNDFETPQPSRR